MYPNKVALVKEKIQILLLFFLFAHFNLHASDEKSDRQMDSHLIPTMVKVEGGSFDMGDWEEAYILEDGYDNIKDVTDGLIHGQDLTYDQRTIHSVTLNDFYIAATEITFEEFDIYCNDTGDSLRTDEGWGRADYPILHVTWIDALKYCNWLSEKEGLDPCYTINGYEAECDFTKNGFRLPTEAEWEYAARGGHLLNRELNDGHGNIYSGTSNFSVLEDYCWFNVNSDWDPDTKEGHSSATAQKLPNELGLHDMSGNVWEWCWDFYSPDYYDYCVENPDECDNPKGPVGPDDKGAYPTHVLRGGSWGNYHMFVKTVFRFFSKNQVLNCQTNPEYQYSNWRIGFRVCKNSQDNLPTAPKLVYPANKSENISVSFAFIWNSVSEAQSYQILVFSDEALKDTLLKAGEIEDTFYIAQPYEPDSKYYWKVRAVNSYGSSLWSELRSFETVPLPDVPVLVYPADEETEVLIKDSLIWEQADFAESYRLMLAYDAAFLELVFDSTVTDTIFKYSLAENTVYYWKIRGMNSAGESSWSAIRKFTTKADIGEKPVLIYPKNKQTGLDIEFDMTWHPTANAESYDIVISADSSFSLIFAQESATNDTSYHFRGVIAEKDYFWRVRANISDGSGAWSPIWKFTTALCAPVDEPLLLNPENGEGVSQQSAEIEFKWTLVQGAEYYQLQLSFEDADFSEENLILNEEPLFFSEFSIELPAETGPYYWRVRGKNSAGDGPWAVYGRFIIEQLKVREEVQNNTINIYPNPAKGNQGFVIDFGEELICNPDIKLYNSLMKEFEVRVVNNWNNNSYAIVNIDDYVPGIYYLIINIGTRQITRKIIIL